MRFSIFSVLALGAFSIASPTVKPRQDAGASVESLLTDLLSTVKGYTGTINATLAGLTPLSSAADKAAAVPLVGAQIQLITTAVTTTTSEISAIAPATKRSIISIDTVEKRQSVTDEIAIAALLISIFTEIISTIISAAAILGAAALLVFTNPLTGALPALVLAVEAVLNLVLGTVTVVLDALLDTLALALAGAL